MFITDRLSFLHTLKKREYIAVGALFVGCVSLVLFLFVLFRSPGSAEALQVIQPVETVASPAEQIVCDVSGAVAYPGVITLQVGDRVGDAIQAAGGLSDDVDLLAVAEVLNMAEKVRDEQKIFVPFRQQQGKTQSRSGESKNARISLNAASQTELESLPGIGPVKAAEIIRRRPFRSIESLVSDKIVSQKQFDSFVDKIAL